MFKGRGLSMEKYPMINVYRTGRKIRHIMHSKGLTVHDVQNYLGLATPQGIYHWFCGRNMPSIDNLYALSELFHVPVDAMLCGNRKSEFSFSNHSYDNRLYAYCEKFLELKIG